MDPGVTLLVASVAVGLVGSFVVRRRLPRGVVVAVLAASGAGIGWGGMLLQADPPAPEFLSAVVLLAVLVPAHVRIVVGPFGPPRERP